jgi:hypothetical protein
VAAIGKLSHSLSLILGLRSNLRINCGEVQREIDRKESTRIDNQGPALTLRAQTFTYEEKMNALLQTLLDETETYIHQLRTYRD